MTLSFMLAPAIVALLPLVLGGVFVAAGFALGSRGLSAPGIATLEASLLAFPPTPPKALRRRRHLD
jgi:hypothetical protein